MNAELLAGRKSNFRVWGRGQLFGAQAGAGFLVQEWRRQAGPAWKSALLHLAAPSLCQLLPALSQQVRPRSQAPPRARRVTHTGAMSLSTWAPSPLPRLPARPPGPSPHHRTARAAIQLISTRSRRHRPARVPTTEPSFQECGHSVRDTEAPN